MSSDTERLEQTLKELERKVETLSARCEDLESRLVRLAVAKVSDPRYPFWNWMLGRGISDETRLRLTALLSALQGRITGMHVPNADVKLGVSHDLLYGSGPLQTDALFAAIKAVAGLENDWQVVEMIRAVNEQGMFRELCEHVMSSIRVSSL